MNNLGNKDEWEAVYCHFDGYPDGVGDILVKHYSEIDDAKALISLGQLSYIRPTTEESFAYHRDREEDWALNKPIKGFGGESEFFAKDWSASNWAEWVYLLTPDGWKGLDQGNIKAFFKPMPLNMLIKLYLTNDDDYYKWGTEGFERWIKRQI